MDEQVRETTTSEITTGPVETVENKTTDVTPKTYSQEEYDKAIKSSASKAKYEILKELGVSSVQDFTNLKETYDKAIKTSEDLTKANENLSNRLVLKDLNIRDDVEDDFISLAKKRVTEDKTFEVAAKEVADLYPNMIKEFEVNKSVKVGSEKKEGSKQESKYSEEMLKRYPFLRNNNKI